MRYRIYFNVSKIYSPIFPPKADSPIIIIGFSQKDSDKILDTLDRIHDILPKKMEARSKDFNQITEKLQKIQTALSNAPAEKDENEIFKPHLDKIHDEYEKIAVLKTEIRHLEDKIQIKKGEISIKKAEGKKIVADKHGASDTDTNIELTKKVQNALDEYFINSAPLLLVINNLAPFLIIGSYKDVIFFIISFS